MGQALPPNGQFNTNAIIDFVTRTMASSDADEIMAYLREVSVGFGMDSFAIAGIPLPNEKIDPYVLLNDWPMDWFNHYAEQDYVHIDPVIFRTKTSNDGFVWSEALKNVRLSPAARTVMNEATEVDMRDGFSVPIQGINGLQAIVTFGAHKVELTREARSTLELIAVFAHHRLRMLREEERNMQHRKELRITKRELDLIQWCAAGKTNWEIGEILGLSHKTVQNELGKIQRKLNAVNRTQLIAESFRAGIIR